jgi:hypothetical protein
VHESVSCSAGGVMYIDWHKNTRTTGKCAAIFAAGDATSSVPQPTPARSYMQAPYEATGTALTFSQSLASSTGTEEPPGMTACRLLQPPRTPPQWRSSSSRRVIDISSSTTIGLFTWPGLAWECGC